jgi:hypothetical protein
MNRQASLDSWPELINNFQSSGQSMVFWCRNNNLKVHQLTYRLQKTKETSAVKQTSWLPITLGGDAAFTVKVGPYAIINRVRLHSTLGYI